ncbi:MAG: hypothetical protein WC529_02845 [Candidatus Margulisiibacteriota bacterium]
MKRLLSLLLLGAFLLGLVPLAPVAVRSAEGKARKKIVRRVKKKKAVKKKKRVIRKARKVAKKSVRLPKKTALKKPAAKKPIKDDAEYQLPGRTGNLTQRYSLEEGLGEQEADNVIGELKALGADDAAIDVNNNALSVTFNPAELSAIGIIKKLKELGYTVKRIN